MSTEVEALARVASERELIRRIDANILALLDAGHDFSPAGLVVDNRTSLSDDALVGRRDGPPETHELTDVVVGDIVVADPEVNIDDLMADRVELCAMAPYADEPVCTCPITDPVAQSTAYTVANMAHEPHACDCPRRDMVKTNG